MRALYLGGGAAKGSYNVGILKHLIIDKNINYDLFIGVSVGAINAAFMSMFSNEEEGILELENIWTNIVTKNIYVGWHSWGIFNYLKAPWRKSLYNNKPLSELINNNIDQHKINSSGKKLLIGAYNLNSGKYHIFDETYKDISKSVLASASLPIAFPPTKIENEYYIDGALKPFMPLKRAISIYDINSIDVIYTSPEKELNKDYIESPNIIQLGPRIIDIMSEEIMSNDLNQMLEINRLIKNGTQIPNKKYIDINIYRPAKKLTESSLDFSQENIKPMLEKGYQDAHLIKRM